MRELSLFTGAGGGLTGTALLGWEPIGYVEWNEYCQKVIRQRIEDGAIPRAPIFSDVRAFTDQGYAAAYSGMVDVITAGFPCQPFSVSGKRKGESDDRNMWPATRDVICAVRPRVAYLENVPGLLADGYIKRIFGDLAEMGFDARWGVLGGSDVGGYAMASDYGLSLLRPTAQCWKARLITLSFAACVMATPETMMKNGTAKPENEAQPQQVAANNALLRRQWVRTERALPPTRTHVFVITDYFPEGMGILWRHGNGFIHMASAEGYFETVRRGGVEWVRRNIHMWMAP